MSRDVRRTIERGLRACTMRMRNDEFLPTVPPKHDLRAGSSYVAELLDTGRCLFACVALWDDLGEILIAIQFAKGEFGRTPSNTPTYARFLKLFLLHNLLMSMSALLTNNHDNTPRRACTQVRVILYAPQIFFKCWC